MTSPALSRPAPETTEVESRRISCDGGNGDLISPTASLHEGGGHPRVYLTIGAEGFVDCTYCDRRFVLKAGAGGHSH